MDQVMGVSWLCLMDPSVFFFYYNVIIMDAMITLFQSTLLKIDQVIDFEDAEWFVIQKSSVEFYEDAVNYAGER